jgi:tetratricopeptide (TPR) repeat protein
MSGDLSERYRTGLVALAREQLDEAEPLLRSVVDEAPDEPEPLAYLATTWAAMGRIEAAREAMDRALELGPNHFAPHLKGGELALRLGDLDSAEGHFRRALEVAPHGSRDAAAARTLLGTTRRQASRSIGRQTAFPRWQRPAFLHRAVAARVSSPVEDGGSIE